MPVSRYTKFITVTNAGGNLQQPVTDSFDSYQIDGSATMIGNLQITPSGIPFTGCTYYFIWKANLDIVTNSTTVTVFGKALTAVQVTKLNYITCTYKSTSWDVDIQTSDGNTAFIENFQLGANIVQAGNIANGAIGTSQLTNGSVTLAKLAANSVDSSKIVDGSIVTADLADNSVTTPKIVDLNVTTAKINDLAVTTGKINADAVITAKILDSNVTANKLASNSVTTVKILDANVTTAKVADDAITNAKLAQMTPSSIKTGDSSGNPIDLYIGLDEIPIGDGTGVTTINKSTLGLTFTGQLYCYHFNISFATTKQAHNRIYLPFPYHLENIICSTVETLSGSDDGYIDVYNNVGSFQSVLSYYPSIAASNPQNYTSAFPAPASNALDVNVPGGWLELRTSKATAGGELLVTVIVKHL